MSTANDNEDLLRERDNLKKILGDINSKYLEKIEELSLIRRIGDAFRDITDFATVCRSVVSIIQQELDPDNCSLMVVDEERGELVLRAAKGPYDAEASYFEPGAARKRFKICQSIAGLVARRGTSMVVQDVRSEERFVAGAGGQVEIGSLMSIPLVVGERVVAVLNFSHSQPGACDAAKERVLAIIANSSAAALENTRLYERLRQSRDQLARENIDLKNELTKKFSAKNILGASRSFAEVLRKVEKVAPVDASVLITGESGTGKELIARTIHYNSPRAARPLVAVNCAALPENLLESELFGIEKGVATGVERRAGKFELANGGTIFLDEIGDMSLATQAKILRALQEREIQRVGGSQTIRLDVRVIAATNKDLEQAIRAGDFREDLYYRLKVVAMHVPPLRERRDDIPLLANYFLREALKKYGPAEKWFSQEALALLISAPWKGNVRELENVVEQAVILSHGEVIGPHDLAIAQGVSPAELRVVIPADRTSYRETLSEVTALAEARLIQNALAQCNNNRSQAARLLGIGRRTLLYKLGKM